MFSTNFGRLGLFLLLVITIAILLPVSGASKFVLQSKKTFQQRVQEIMRKAASRALVLKPGLSALKQNDYESAQSAFHQVRLQKYPDCIKQEAYCNFYTRTPMRGITLLRPWIQQTKDQNSKYVLALLETQAADLSGDASAHTGGIPDFVEPFPSVFKAHTFDEPFKAIPIAEPNSANFLVNLAAYFGGNYQVEPVLYLTNLILKRNDVSAEAYAKVAGALDINGYGKEAIHLLQLAYKKTDNSHYKEVLNRIIEGSLRTTSWADHVSGGPDARKKIQKSVHERFSYVFWR